MTSIPLARMMRKMGPAADYYKLMESAFIICVDGLTDTTTTNDFDSLRLLAKVLSLAGLEREVRIALSAQYSLFESEEDDEEGDKALDGTTEADDGEAHETTNDAKEPGLEKQKDQNGNLNANGEVDQDDSAEHDAGNNISTATDGAKVANGPDLETPDKQEDEEEHSVTDEQVDGEKKEQEERRGRARTGPRERRRCLRRLRHRLQRLEGRTAILLCHMYEHRSLSGMPRKAISAKHAEPQRAVFLRGQP